ncbi:hypothetical protein [Mesorhizobium sp. LNHC221B00]|uniref:hypothetical protein n=1 Tax=Mesorhizobium sp. LNHC221B00 TaxID=1287233 RepID=UPI0012EC69B7|nr:hypothetical protein [Mesorhizobium sp. LNHC221B00]
MTKKKMLTLFSASAGLRRTLQCRQVERQYRRPCRQLFRNDRQHVCAPARRPKHGRTAPARLSETKHRNATGAGRRDQVDGGSTRQIVGLLARSKQIMLECGTAPQELPSSGTQR